MDNKDQKKLPRLKDVAAQAKVSLGTASRILNGDSTPFDEKTAERVRAAAAHLGWRRNLLVSGMQTGRTRTVGVVITPYDSYWINVISGIHKKLRTHQYLPITIWLGDLPDKPFLSQEAVADGTNYINHLLERRIDGLIVSPGISERFEDYLRELTTQSIPVATIESRAERPLGDRVHTNETAAAEAVAKYLAKLGHQRIACFYDRPDFTHDWSGNRMSAFKQALTKYPSVRTVDGRISDSGIDAFEVACSLLTNEQKPTVIYAASDQLAKIVYFAANHLNLKIPADVSVIGFANLDFATVMYPALTTVEQNPVEIGAQAAAQLIERLKNGSQDDFQDIEILGKLVVRDSTGPPGR